MAFVTVLSDFFSCGRSRKTRQPSIGAIDDKDATSEPPVHETAEATAPTLGLSLAPLPALALLDEKPTDEVDARPQTGGHEAGRLATTQQLDVQSALPNRYYDSAADQEVELSVVQEKAKSSTGWMVEQRVLVTTMPVAASKDAEKTTSVSEPEAETNTVIPPVRCATPELEPWISSSVARSQTPEPMPEPEVSAVSPVVRPASPQAQTVDVVSIRSATPDIVVRPVTPQEQPVDVAPVLSATPDIEPVIDRPAKLEPEEISLPVSEEIVTPVPEPKIEAPKVQAAKRTTPLTFLSMPPGMYPCPEFFQVNPLTICRGAKEDL